MHVDLRELVVDVIEQVDVPVERQLRVHAALHQDLRAADVDELPHLAEQGVVVEGVGVVVAEVLPEYRTHFAVQTFV